MRGARFTDSTTRPSPPIISPDEENLHRENNVCSVIYPNYLTTEEPKGGNFTLQTGDSFHDTIGGHGVIGIGRYEYHLGIEMFTLDPSSTL